MDDFKIDDNYEENGEVSEESSNSPVPIIIIIVISLVIGLLVFFVSNALFGRKVIPAEPPKDTEVSLTDENVKILYDYVTYGPKNVRSDKFLKEQSVNLNSFTNQEKFYYALQFAQVEDFTATGEVDENNLKIYRIPSNKIKNYMERFFGSKVTYATNSVITYPFSFRINNKNVGVMTYSVEKDGYNTVFTGLEEDVVSDKVVEPYYTKLVKAIKNGKDGSLELQEKVIYTDVQENNGVYTIGIYQDYQHTVLLETKQNLTAEQLKQNPITIDSYQEKASTVKYLFKLNNTIYYFDSSTITSG